MKTYTFKVTVVKNDVVIETVEANSLQEAENEIRSLYMYFGVSEYYFRCVKVQ